MSDFVVQVETLRGPQDAWARLWDLDTHTRVIPLTRVSLDLPATALGEGAGFTGRTALGPLGFDDTMVVDGWEPPTSGSAGRAVVRKTSRLLGGRIEVTVDPLRAGARITWRQDVRLPWLPRHLRGLEAVAARLAAPGYRRVVRTLLR